MHLLSFCLLLLPFVSSTFFSSSCRCQCRSPCLSPSCPSLPCKRSLVASMLRRRAILKRRVRREVKEFAIIDTNCNSEELRDIIIEKTHRMTSVSKRQIQKEAEERLGGRFNVICARGDFSYITNTDIFCQQTVGDVTCYAFKQLTVQERFH